MRRMLDSTQPKSTATRCTMNSSNSSSSRMLVICWAAFCNETRASTRRCWKTAGDGLVRNGVDAADTDLLLGAIEIFDCGRRVLVAENVEGRKTRFFTTARDRQPAF